MAHTGGRGGTGGKGVGGTGGGRERRGPGGSARVPGRVLGVGTRLLAAWAAVLLAARVVPGVVLGHPDGPTATHAGVRALTALVIAVFVLLVGALGRFATAALIRRATAVDWESPGWRWFLAVACSVAAGWAWTLLAGPLGLWAGSAAARALGLPIRLTGPAAGIVGGLVVGSAGAFLVICVGLLRPTRARAPERAARTARARGAGAVALTAAAFALADWILPGVRLGPAPAPAGLLVLVGLACVYGLRPALALTLPVPGASALVLLAVDTLALWAVSRAGYAMEPAFRIHGFWTLVAVAALVRLLTWPTRRDTAEPVSEPPLFPPEFPAEPMGPFPPPR
ncbi:hypothetical protein ACN20G_31555 (plasmid) [Streptomyces sp. BI20]|uniref:hypothetical protein n=1 Tax=Streptomyces sp. BI20 TaxID=3403460 RepID=UPI003C74E857